MHPDLVLNNFYETHINETIYPVGNLAEIENRIEKDLGCTLSNLVEYNTYENGTLTLFSL